jgi:hypothetical protein
MLHKILEQALYCLLSDEKYIGEKSKQKQDLCKAKIIKETKPRSTYRL